MFNWMEPDKPVVVKLPFEIYWGVVSSVTVLLAVGLLTMASPKWIPKLLIILVDRVSSEGFKTYLQKGRLYLACQKIIKHADSSESVESTNRNDEALKKKIVPVKSNDGLPESQANDKNGKGTSKDETFQRGSNSELGLIHRDRSARFGEDMV